VRQHGAHERRLLSPDSPRFAPRPLNEVTSKEQEEAFEENHRERCGADEFNQQVDEDVPNVVEVR
jgi:hypothetical protein